jgi:hypothetical protein
MIVTPWHKSPGKPWNSAIFIPTPVKTSGEQ